MSRPNQRRRVGVAILWVTARDIEAGALAFLTVGVTETVPESNAIPVPWKADWLLASRHRSGHPAQNSHMFSDASGRGRDGDVHAR
jgi:hypothetical protein